MMLQNFMCFFYEATFVYKINFFHEFFGCYNFAVETETWEGAAFLCGRRAYICYLAEPA